MREKTKKEFIYSERIEFAIVSIINDPKRATS